MTAFQNRIRAILNGGTLTQEERDQLAIYNLACDNFTTEALEEVASVEMKTFIESFGKVN